MATCCGSDGVTRCPDGIARHAHDLATRGTGILVTCWPNPQNQLKSLPWHHVRGVPLWQQEMAILTLELSPKIAARMHWERLWRALQEIPIEDAIEDDAPKRVVNASSRVRTCSAIWTRERTVSPYSSVFCANQECGRCKQVDCDCKCHAS
jgi:hypothetical protein